jgi:hydrogenase maturation protease
MTVSEVEITVLGVGDVLASDEGVGIRAAHRARSRLPDDVRVLELRAVDRTALDHLDGASHILVLECIDVGREPGTIVCFDAEDLSPCAARSVHDFGVADLLVLVGQSARAPEQALVLGVQPASRNPGTRLSPAVEVAVPGLVERAVEVVNAWAAGLVPVERLPKEPCGDGPTVGLV